MKLKGRRKKLLLAAAGIGALAVAYMLYRRRQFAADEAEAAAAANGISPAGTVALGQGIPRVYGGVDTGAGGGGGSSSLAPLASQPPAAEQPLESGYASGGYGGGEQAVMAGAIADPSYAPYGISDAEVEAMYGALPGSAAFARGEGPDPRLALGGGWNITAPVENPANPGWTMQGANYALAMQNYSPAPPPPPGFHPSGVPQTMYDQNLADRAAYQASGAGARDGYMRDNQWVSF